MDSTRFDALTRSLATAANRRAFIRTACAAVAAGVGGALEHASVLADECKGDNERCKKHEQCCSGVCVPNPTAGSTSKSDSVCCTPESNELTCVSQCGKTVVNGCGQSIECGHCADEICAEDADCNSADCCEGSCCTDDVSSTAACCRGSCCDCFQDHSPGGGGTLYCCPPDREICGPYPHDDCCLPQDTCVAGRCVPKPLACPPEGHAGGPNQDCSSGCCGATDTSPGICCPADRPDCVLGVCVATTAISCADQSVCPAGTLCTAYDGNSGVCCPSNRYYEIETGDSEVPLAKQCCFAGQEARGCDESPCTPVSYLGCSATFRGSQPRIG